MRYLPEILFLFTGFASCFPLIAYGSDYRKFKNTDGATIEAIIVDATYTTITIRRKDGREFKDVSLERFSVEDRRFVRKWIDKQAKAISDADLTHESRVDVTVKRGVDEDMNNYGDIDDRIIEFKPGIVVDNQEIEQTFQNVEGELVIVGRGVIEKDSYVILNKQTFSVTLNPRERTRWYGDPFKCKYDPDYGGFEYAGYLVVLKNKAGQIMITKASKSSWERNSRAILEAKSLRGYDRDFGSEFQLFNTFGLPGR